MKTTLIWWSIFMAFLFLKNAWGLPALAILSGFIVHVLAWFGIALPMILWIVWWNWRTANKEAEERRKILRNLHLT
jgi:threonine/homoserine/homoserine lactone efflux protein